MPRALSSAAFGAWFTSRAMLLSLALEGRSSVHSGGVASLSFSYLVYTKWV